MTKLTPTYYEYTLFLEDKKTGKKRTLSCWAQSEDHARQRAARQRPEYNLLAVEPTGASM